MINDTHLIRLLSVVYQTRQARSELIGLLDTETLGRLRRHFAGYDPHLHPDGAINARLIDAHLNHRLMSLAVLHERV